MPQFIPDSRLTLLGDSGARGSPNSCPVPVTAVPASGGADPTWHEVSPQRGQAVEGRGVTCWLLGVCLEPSYLACQQPLCAWLRLSSPPGNGAGCGLQAGDSQ